MNAPSSVRVGRILRQGGGAMPYDPSTDVAYSRAALDAGAYDAPGTTYLGKEPGPPVKAAPPPTVPVTTGRSQAAPNPPSSTQGQGKDWSKSPLTPQDLVRTQGPAAGASAPPAPQGAASSSNSFMNALMHAESGGRNIYSGVDPDTAGPGTRSQGYYQIGTPTWQQFAPRAGVDINQWGDAIHAPPDVQASVASQIPLSRFGPRTRNMLHQQFGAFDDRMTVGELAARYGQGGGGGGADQPSAYASEAQARTASPGGGYVLPGGGTSGDGDGAPSGRPGWPSPSFWNGLIMAGGAMMAGTSPYAGVNIGKGLEAFGDYQQKQTQLDREWAKNQAEIDNLSSEARSRDADIRFKTNQMNIETLNAKMAIWQRQHGAWIAGGMKGPEPQMPDLSAVLGSQGAPAPSVAFGSGSGAPAPQPAAGGPSVSRAPSGGPSMQQAPAPAPGASAAQPAAPASQGAPGPQGAQLGQRYLDDADDLDRQADAWSTQGDQQSLQTANQLRERAQAKREFAQKLLEASPQYKGSVKETEAGVEARSKQDEAIAQGYQQRQIAEQRAQVLLTLLKTYKTGMGADWKADVVRAIKATGFDPASLGLDPSTAANYQEFVKNSTASVMDAVKSMPGQPRVAEIQTFAKASPSAELDPDANRAILAQALGILDYQTAHADAYTDWRRAEGRSANTIDLLGFDRDFVKKTPKLSEFVTRRQSRIGIRPSALATIPRKLSWDSEDGHWEDPGTGKKYDFKGNLLK